MALRAKKSARSSQDYINHLFEAFSIFVSPSYMSNFLKSFNYKGKFNKSILVPVNRFRVVNKARYFEFMHKVQQLSDHIRWIFVDEKHLINKDTLPGKVRANSLAHHVDAISVSSDFEISTI